MNIKKHNILVLLVVLCMMICACSDPRGPQMYYLNTRWETDGNCVSVTDVFPADCYCTSEGVEYKPEEGSFLLIVQLKTELEDKWIISQKTTLEEVGYTDNERSTMLEYKPIFDNGTCLLLFILNSDSYSANAEDYELLLYLECGAQIRNQTFQLRMGP